MQINSSEEDTIPLWGGIRYCLQESNKKLFCLADYEPKRLIGIAYGENIYDSTFVMTAEQIDKIESSKNLFIEINLVGQDGTVVQYNSSVTFGT